MRVTVGNVKALVEGNSQELQWAQSYLTWQVPGVVPPEYRTVWDAQTRSFPAGLAPVLARGAMKAGIPAVLLDIRRPPPGMRPVPADWLRDYQREAFDACLARAPVNGLPGRGIVQLPTGAGKTRLAASVAYAVPIKWCFIVNSQDLLAQTALSYESLTSEQCGRIGDGLWTVGRFTVATVQSLHRCLRDPFLAQVQGVFHDEAHGAAATTSQEVMAAMPNAYYRFGLSATPLDRSDGANLLTVGALGPVIYRSSIQKLRDKGVLAGARITFAQYPPLSRAAFHKAEALARYDQRAAFREAYDVGVMNNMSRNARVVQLARAAPKPCLTFVKLVEHGNLLEGLLRRAGLATEFVSGRDGSRERKEGIKSLVRGDTEVLICSGIFNQGVDIPELRSLINAAGGKSSILAVQRLGRGTRKVAGKDEVQMWDFLDAGIFLARHAKERMKVYEREGHQVVVGEDSTP